MEPNVANASPQAGGKVMGVGAILALIGVVFMAKPDILGMGIAALIGFLLIVLGLFRLAFAWVSASWGSTVLQLLVGGLAVAAGVVMLTDPSRGLEVLTVILGIYLLLDGISEVAMSLSLRPVGGMWLMISGIVSIVLAVMIWRQWPTSGEWALGFLIGIKLLVDGLAILAVGFGIKKATS